MSTIHDARGTARRPIHLVSAAAALAILVAASSASASHFRFAHNTWRRVSGNVVEFTSTQAWRSDFLDNLPINFGDGTGSGSATPTTIGTFTDQTGASYTVRRYTIQHTYATEGPYTAFSSSCCRISTLVNAADASERIESVVDLRNSNQGSPVSSIPVILQMVQGGVNNVPLPVADPDLDPISCRMATSAESQIPTVATAGGFTLGVTPGCVLTWDTSGTVVGQKYAAQVMVEETHAGNPSRVALDFIIEIVGGTLNQPPACSGISSQQIVNVGQAFQTTFTGTDPDGDALTVSHLGLPTGATLTPPSGTQQAEPFDATFDWTPQAGDAGSAHAVTIVYTDPDGLQATCSFSITVPLCGDGVVDAPAEECDPSAPPSCSSGEVCTNSCECAVPTATPTATATATDTATATPTETATPVDTPTATATDTPPPLPDTPTPTALPPGSCSTSPAVGCFSSEGSRRWIVRLRDSEDGRRDRLLWKWRGASAGVTGDLGDPTSTTSYGLCLYAGSTPTLLGEWEIPSGADCPGCWRSRRRGFVFRSDGATDGMRKVVLRSDPLRARAQFKIYGKGIKLPLPPLPLTQPVLVQLIKSEGNECWEATYGAPARKNTSSEFLDVAD